jgi:flagellar biosynthesis protein FlhA
VDPLRIELGYSLVRLVDGQQKGQLLERIASLRRQVAEELGMLVPPVRICDNLRLEGRRYQILVRGLKAAEGLAQPGLLLAVGATAESLKGQPASEPVFGTSAVWVSQSERARAEAMGYTVVDAGGVIVTHLAEVVRRHAPSLLGRQQTMSMLDALRPRSPHLVDDVLGRLGAARIHKLLCGLLEERVSVRDLEAVLEAAGDFPGPAQDAEGLVEHVRSAMAATLSQPYVGPDGRLRCVCLPSDVEEQIGEYVSDGPAAAPLELGRELADRLGGELRQLQEQGRQAVVLCSPRIRPALRRLIAGNLPDVVVLGYNEIESVDVDLVEA